MISLGISLAPRRGGAAVAPLYPTTNRMGTAANLISKTGTGRTGSDTQLQVRNRFYNLRACSRFKLRFANEIANGASLTDGPSNLTIKATFRKSGSIRPVVTFGGASSVTLAPGQVVESDWINEPLAAGTYYSYYVLGTYAAAPPSGWPASTIRANNYDEYQEWGSSLTDRTGTDWNSGSRVENYTMFGALDLVTDTAQSGPAVMLLGDSISSNGANDATSGDYLGYAQRALGTAYPWVSTGAAGLQLSVALGSQKSRRIDRYAGRGYTHVLCPLGTNDVSAGYTSAQIITMLATAKSAFDGMGMRFVPFTLPPRTNATNDGENTAGNWATVAAVNAHIRANNGVGYSYFDVNSYWADPVNPNLWRTDLGTPTTDGIHPGTALHTAAYNALVSALPGLLSGA